MAVRRLKTVHQPICWVYVDIEHLLPLHYPPYLLGATRKALHCPVIFWPKERANEGGYQAIWYNDGLLVLGHATIYGQNRSPFRLHHY
jgi:hypothetical protein